MHRIVIVGLLGGLLTAGAAPAPSGGTDAPACHIAADEPNEVDLAIESLQNRAAELKSYQARVDYTTKQPLLDSQARREGVLYYAKRDDRSSLRIDFLTLQQDDEPRRRYVEQFLFDGVWLVIVNHQTKRVERRQLTEPDDPIDAFSLASRHMPVLGFSKIDDLRKQFDVRVVAEPQDRAALRRLHLTVRPDSVYKDDYTTIEFWIDRKIGLPARIVAETTEEDIHDIRLIEPKANQGIDPKVFQIDVPRGFSVEVIPLEPRTQRE